MVSRLKSCLYMVALCTATAFPATSLDLLSSANATWTVDVGNSTCTIATRASGDSIVASWKVNQGLWSNTWVSIVATLNVSLAGADSLILNYTNADADGFSLRLTERDGTKWQSPLYLNGLVGLQGGFFALNVTSFPQQKDSVTQANGVFNLDSMKTISFVSNKNPTTVAVGGVTGVYKITKFTAPRNGSAGISIAASSSPINVGGISSTGFTAPKAGVYSVAAYRANGKLVRLFRGNYSAGFNKIGFSKLGRGMFIVKVNGNGLNTSRTLILN